MRKVLAERLAVSPSAVAHYLRGASAPSAEKTLLMLEWIAERENAQPKKDPVRALTRTGQATRSKKPKSNEKPKPDRKRT